MEDFLPISREDMEKRGWPELDFVFVSGDAYVDHPSFGPAILTRLLEKHGYKVGIIPQPNWRKSEDFRRLGKPRLAFLVSAGNMDSMLNAYTAAKKMRGRDAYSPGGRIGLRPPRATAVYVSRLRELFPGVPVIIGGIEASLRRLAHYDYWSDKVRRSILADSLADILVYGMGERALLAVAHELNQGVAVQNIQDVAGTAFRVPNFDYLWDYVRLPSFDEVRSDKKAFAAAVRADFSEQDALRGRRLAQQNGEWCIAVNPPAKPLTVEEMDEVYDLPYRRAAHPIYDSMGGIPAFDEVKFGLIGQRGCFGGCNFCAIVSHEGRVIQSRSHASLLKEARLITNLPDFKGYIHDVGGPTANFRCPSCERQLKSGTCRDKSCLSPKPCANLVAEHSDYLSLLAELRRLPGVKKVFVRSGVRFDYLMLAKDGQKFLRELVKHHISGQLKIAPEHVSPRVTRLMGKSDVKIYEAFAAEFARLNKELGLKQYLVPYFMSGHPGSTLQDAVKLAEFMRDHHLRPRQVQDFIPTPGTLSTCMYYTGLNPLTGEKVYVPKTAQEKKWQRALLQYWRPECREDVRRALSAAGRDDLIGYGSKCLVEPAPKSEKRR